MTDIREGDLVVPKDNEFMRQLYGESGMFSEARRQLGLKFADGQPFYVIENNGYQMTLSPTPKPEPIMLRLMSGNVKLWRKAENPDLKEMMELL